MKLLPEFKGMKVTAKAVNGYITFDTNTTPESEYPRSILWGLISVLKSLNRNIKSQFHTLELSKKQT